jgi:hypothetical protein
VTTTPVQPGLRVPAADVGLVVIVAVALILALVVGTHPRSQPTAAAVPVAPVATAANPQTVATPTTAQAADPVTSDEIQQTVQAYADAYSAEDVDGLAAVFSSRIVRTAEGSPTLRGGAAVLGEYQRQFDANAVVDYSLEPDEVTPGDGEGSISGRYTIVLQDGSQSTGSIAMHLIRGRSGDVLIDQLAVVAD